MLGDSIMKWKDLEKMVNVAYNPSLPNTMFYVFLNWMETTRMDVSHNSFIIEQWKKDNLRLIIKESEWHKALEQEHK